MKYAMWMKTSKLVITIVVIVTGVWDFIAAVWGGTGTSISNLFIIAGLKDLNVVFCLGFISGHFFGGMRPKQIDDKGNFIEDDDHC